MNRRYLALAVTTILFSGLLAAGPEQDVETFLRQGNAAFGRGDYLTAIAFFEKAEAMSTDPGQVAFNLAVARYFQVQEQPGERMAGLREAEMLFRCCLDGDSPRQGRAWYGLGLCLLNRAADREDLVRAVDCFDHCLHLTVDKDPLQATAREERELARLRLSQFQGPQARDDEESPNQDNPKQESRPDRRPQASQMADDGTGQALDKSSRHGEKVRVKQGPGSTPRATQEPPPPGSGNLPPVPDRADLPPLSSQDATGLLDQASRRILDEERSHRQSKARPTPQGVRDW